LVNLCCLRFANPRAQAESISNFGGDADVFEHRELGKNLGNLERSGHAASNAFMGCKPRDVVSIEDDGA